MKLIHIIKAIFKFFRYVFVKKTILFWKLIMWCDVTPVIFAYETKWSLQWNIKLWGKISCHRHFKKRIKIWKIRHQLCTWLLIHSIKLYNQYICSSSSYNCLHFIALDILSGWLFFPWPVGSYYRKWVSIGPQKWEGAPEKRDAHISVGDPTPFLVVENIQGPFVQSWVNLTLG
jgi:hypothetical protein